MLSMPTRSAEELFQTPYHIIDILPTRVLKDSPGQYFEVAEYFLQPAQMATVKQRHINVVLKLNCYHDIRLDENGAINPDPQTIERIMRMRFVPIFIQDALIVSEHDDTHMTIFNADDELLELVGAIARSEGLFVWNPGQGAM